MLKVYTYYEKIAYNIFTVLSVLYDPAMSDLLPFTITFSGTNCLKYIVTNL